MRPALPGPYAGFRIRRGVSNSPRLLQNANPELPYDLHWPIANMKGEIMSARRSVLLIEDSPQLAKLYETQLLPLQVPTSLASTGETGLNLARSDKPDVIVLDIQLPGISGFDVLRTLKDEGNNAVIVVMTAHSTINTAVEAMRLGAYDFLVKPFDAERLRVTVANALEHRELTQIVDVIQQGARATYHDFIGSSLPMQAVYRTIDASAASKASVFITGESGTGKEVCAEAIHREGPRRNGPFIAINCGAIPGDLMESEIFGHKRGSFTGAVADRVGAAELADGGTLFLDELAEMDIGLQVKLLRFTQTGVFYRVGETKAKKVDTRFISATNLDPTEAIANGQLREDLYYRLNVIPIQMPPLRERGDDVVRIAEALLAGFAKEEGKRFESLDADVSTLFRHYEWPGNVRQLQNVLRNVVVLHDGDTVTLDMLPAPLSDFDGEDDGSMPYTGPERRSTTLAPDPAPPASDIEPEPDAIPTLAEVERDAIERAVAICGGNIPRAAAALGVAPSTLYRKRQSWGDGVR